MPGLKIIFGAGSFNKMIGYQSAEDIKGMLDLIGELGIKDLDTATVYGESESWLGENKAASRFDIGTKYPGVAWPEPATEDQVISVGKSSLEKLATKQVDIYYMHSPDVRVPFEETLAGINELYKAGAFRRFGLSNYSPQQVEEVVQICNDRGYVLPSVYQGNYNAVARLAEQELLPLLRKHKIAFYAYSPIAGGFLAKNPTDFEDKDALKGGRWDPETMVGKLYRILYSDRPQTLNALKRWHEIAAEEGITGAELAFRWVVHNSALDASLGDGAVIGAGNEKQLRNTWEAIAKGPLSADVQAKVDAVWGPLKEDAFLDNFFAFNEMKEGGADVTKMMEAE